MTTNFVAKGADIIKQAVLKDNDEDYEAALSLYVQGVEFWMTALKYEENEQICNAIKQKTKQYMERAEEIKAALQQNPIEHENTGGTDMLHKRKHSEYEEKEEFDEDDALAELELLLMGDIDDDEPYELFDDDGDDDDDEYDDELLSKAAETIREAVTKDNDEEYEEAVVLYEKGIKLMMSASANVTSGPIHERIMAYAERVKTIKETTHNTLVHKIAEALPDHDHDGEEFEDFHAELDEIAQVKKKINDLDIDGKMEEKEMDELELIMNKLKNVTDDEPDANEDNWMETEQDDELDWPPLCFCKKRLKKDPDPDDEWVCHHCFMEFNDKTDCYYCLNEECIYFQLVALDYLICGDCFKIMQTREVHIYEINDKHFWNNKLKSNIETMTINIQKIINSETEPDHAYAFRLYYNFYSKILSKFKGAMNTDPYYLLVMEFDKIYKDKFMKYMAHCLDRKQLLLQHFYDDDMDEDSININILSDATKTMIEIIKMEWHTIQNADDGCDDVKQCLPIHRMVYVLQLFKKYFLDKHNDEMDFILVFNYCITEYGLVQMMNDMNHIDEIHHNYHDLKELSANQELIPFCKNQECHSLQRKYRKKREDEDEDEEHNMDIMTELYGDKYREIKDTNDILIIEYMDKAHTALNHRQSLVVDEETQIKMRNLVNPRFRDTNDGKKDDENQHKFSKFITEINNQEEKSTAVAQFGFGERCFYYKWYKKQDPQHYIESPIHSNLKHELLRNTIYKISLSQWNLTLKKANTYKQCSIAKRMKSANSGGHNLHHEMPVNLPITISYLMVLLLYTNYTELQFRFKKYTTRKLGKNDTLKELRQRNRNIGNWYKLFYELVMFYGESTLKSSIKSFYTGMSIKLLFSSFCPSFNAPMSTTTDLMVATRFASDGIILELRSNASNTDNFLNVRWCSDYPEESEKVFANANGMMIVDIRDCELNPQKSHTIYLESFYLFDTMFEGYYYIFDIGKRKKGIQKVLCAFIDTYMKQYNGDDDDDDKYEIAQYFMDLFKHSVKTKRDNKLYVIKSEYLLLNQKKLQRNLVTFDDEDKMKLSPFMRTFTDDDQIECLTEYIWLIEGKKFEEFMKLPRGEYMEGDTYVYQCSKPMKGEIEFYPGIFRSSDSFPQNTGFAIIIKSMSSGLTVADMFLCVAVDEVRYTLNGVEQCISKGDVDSVSRMTFPNSKLSNTKIKSLNIRINVRFSRLK